MNKSKVVSNNLCRTCNKQINNVTRRPIYSENSLSSLGQKLFALMNLNFDEELNYFHCCKECSERIEDCFESLSEIQATNSILKQIRENEGLVRRKIYVGKVLNKSNFKLVCCDCKEVKESVEDYVKHFREHILRNVNLTYQTFRKIETKNIKHENMLQDKNKYDKNDNDEVLKSDVKVPKQLPPPNCSLCQLYECDICKSVFKLKNDLSKHIKNVHLNTRNRSLKYILCKYCYDVLPPNTLRRHKSICKQKLFNSRSPYLCHLCGKTMNFKQVRAHMNLHKDLTEGSQTCTICEKVLKNSKALRSHVITHDDTKKVICEVCGERTNPYRMWKHKKQHQDKEKCCTLCGKSFVFAYMLNNHLKMHNKNNLTHISSYKCNKCDQQYAYVSMLNNHLKTVHNETVDVEMSDYSCEVCRKYFDDQFSLKNHLILIHDVSKEVAAALKPVHHFGLFHCTMCTEILKSEYGLRRHMKLVHGLCNREMPTIMRRKCEKCNKSFSNKAGLTAHIKSVHLSSGLLTCDVCNKTFTRHQGLSHHRLIHLGQKPFECEICSRSFRQRADVMRHLERHVRDGQATIETAAARNNSESSKVKTSRIFLKNSSSFSIIK